MLDIKSIENAKHILLKTDNKSFANASALYSYLMTLHKKVTLFSSDVLPYKFSFLPWYEKCKSSIPASADLVVEVSEDSLSYYSFLQSRAVKINVKMATALYAGILLRYNNFSSQKVDGMVFASASELITAGAKYQEAQKYIVNWNSLALFRLKARVLSSMMLKENATHAELFVCNDDLAFSGASLEDAQLIADEVLSIAHVQSVSVFKSDEEMKTIYTIRGE
ncbi:MAG: phosphoesterase [Campylobacterales bacterium]|nr:phosphoesterase [Campylobacterales bacterium]